VSFLLRADGVGCLAGQRTEYFNTPFAITTPTIVHMVATLVQPDSFCSPLFVEAVIQVHWWLEGISLPVSPRLHRPLQERQRVPVGRRRGAR
jgi:hypothetical protein